MPRILQQVDHPEVRTHLDAVQRSRLGKHRVLTEAGQHAIHHSFDYSTLDFPSFEDESNIFDFLGEGGGVGDSGWQINGVDVNTDWNPFNDCVEGADYDFTGLSEGSDWLDTGILAPIYESGEYGTTGSNDALLNALIGQINGGWCSQRRKFQFFE